MPSLEKAIVSNYVNLKDDGKISEKLKQKVIDSISDDGKISEKEEKEINSIILDESKNDNKKTVKKDFEQFIQKVSDFSSNSNFDPKSFQFSLDGNKVNVRKIENIEINNPTEKTDIIDIEVPNLISNTFKKGISDSEKNQSIANINKASGNIFSKSIVELDSKIKQINAKILSLPDDSTEKQKYENIKSVYKSIKTLYSTFSKDIHPSKFEIKNLNDSIKSTYEKIKNLPSFLSDSELKDNFKNITKMMNIVSEFSDISNAFSKYGGKIESSSNNLNEFTVQTFSRLGDPNRNITRNIEGALKSFGYDISDMKIFNDRFSQLLKKAESGGFKNIEQAVAAFRAAAPQTSNKFLADASKLGSSAQKTYIANEEIKKGEKELQEGKKDIDSSKKELREGYKNETNAENQVLNGRENITKKDSNKAKENINSAEQSNNLAKENSNNAENHANSAKSHVYNSKISSTSGKKILAGAKTDISSISKEYSSSLKPTTIKVNSNIEKTDRRISTLDSGIKKSESEIKQVEKDIKSLNSRIEKTDKDIISEKEDVSKIDIENKQKEKKDDIKSEAMELNSEDKKIVDELIKDYGDIPELKEALENIGNLVLEKSSDGKRILDYLNDISKGKLLGTIDKKDLISSIIFNVRNNQNVYQGPHGTCGAASGEVFVLNEKPAEFVKIVTDLATKGESILSDGEKLSISQSDLYVKNGTVLADIENKIGQTENRSAADILFQSAVMNYIALVPSKDPYQSTLDRGDLNSVVNAKSGGNPFLISKLLKSITGSDYKVLVSENVSTVVKENAFIYLGSQVGLVTDLAGTISKSIGITSSNLEMEKNFNKNMEQNKPVIINVFPRGVTGGGHFVTAKGIKYNDAGIKCYVIKDSNMTSDKKNNTQSGETLIPVNELFSSKGFSLDSNGIEYGKKWFVTDLILKK